MIFLKIFFTLLISFVCILKVMSSSRFILAVDVGTTGAKVALVDENGLPAPGKCTSYSRYCSGTIVKNGRVEQIPEEWYDAVVCACKEVMSQATVKPCAIVLSGQMQNTIMLNHKAKKNENAILYSDVRATEESTHLEKRFGGREKLQQLTGLYTGPSSVFAKLLWLNRHKKEAFAQCNKILLGAHSYICWRLCGKYICDYTTASTTGLLDMRHWPPIWLKDELHDLQIDSSKLPTLQSALTISGSLSEVCAKDLNLTYGIPVIHGSGDMGSTSIGAGAGIPGGAYAYIGTSGWIAMAKEGYCSPPKGGFTMLHPDPSLCFQVASMMNAGGNLEWLMKILQASEAADEGLRKIDQLAAESLPGSKGLIYLPYLAGERSPFEDPDVRGAFIGLSLDQGQGEICRAVLEGVSFAYRSLLDVVQDKEALECLRLVGGGAKSQVWQQILSDIMGVDIEAESFTDDVDVATKGAALIASVALGWKERLVDVSKGIMQSDMRTTVKKPNPSLAHLYNQQYSKFLKSTKLIRSLSDHGKQNMT